MNGLTQVQRTYTITPTEEYGHLPEGEHFTVFVARDTTSGQKLSESVYRTLAGTLAEERVPGIVEVAR